MSDAKFIAAALPMLFAILLLVVPAASAALGDAATRYSRALSAAYEAFRCEWNVNRRQA